MRSGCPRACGQRNDSDELVCGTNEVVVVVDAVGVVSNDKDLCQVLNSFVETQEATEMLDCIVHC